MFWPYVISLQKDLKLYFIRKIDIKRSKLHYKRCFERIVFGKSRHLSMADYIIDTYKLKGKFLFFQKIFGTPFFSSRSEARY